jgi:hypothetical protein
VNVSYMNTILSNQKFIKQVYGSSEKTNVYIHYILKFIKQANEQASEQANEQASEQASEQGK